MDDSSHPNMEQPRGEEAKRHSETKSMLGRALAGDQDGYRDLWSRFVRGLEFHVTGRVHKAHAALQEFLRGEIEDIVQVTFHKGFASLATFEYRGQNSCLAYFKTILDNELANRIQYWTRDKRSAFKTQRLRSAEDSRPGPRDPSDPGIDALTQLSLTAEEKRMAVARTNLDEPCQTLIEMRIFAGAGWFEVGELIGTTPDTARMRFKKCQQKLEAEFQRLSED